MEKHPKDPLSGSGVSIVIDTPPAAWLSCRLNTESRNQSLTKTMMSHPCSLPASWSWPLAIMMLLLTLCPGGWCWWASTDLPSHKNFFASVRVLNKKTQETYWVLERVLADSVTLKMFPVDGSQRQHICTYSKASGLGHTIYGLECLPAVNLPAGCFCNSGQTPTAYLPLTDLLDAIAGSGGEPKQEGLNMNHFITWTISQSNLQLSATFIRHANHTTWQPFSILVSHNTSGTNYFSKRDKLCGEIELEYTVQRFDLLTDSSQLSDVANPVNDDPTKSTVRIPRQLDPSSGFGSMGGEIIYGTNTGVAPEGVFCQRPDIYRRRLPDMPDQFSVTIETIDPIQRSVTYSEQHYDLGHKLVSFKFAPRSHTPPAVFFARFILSSAFPNEVFYIVHDFQTQLQYTINERTGNCSVQKIPLVASDVEELHENAHSLRRIKHAKELLSVDPKKFVYAGERDFRGIAAEVWVAENPTSSGYYQTTEIYFSRHDWNVLVEEVNSHRELPLGMAIFSAKHKNDSQFSSKVESHYIEFNPSQPSWKFFDVSSCMRTLDKLFLKITLDVSYSQLVQFSLQRAHDSIRKALAGLCKVSPLRISDLHLSTTPGDKEGIDVWFVLLESARPNDDPMQMGGPMGVARELSVTDAYRQLATLNAQSDVTLRLQISKDREMIAQMRRHSLQMAPESSHPSSHGQEGSYRFLRATYTAGSMAGLGFSMAILGVCIGLFLGFLLWKRRIGVPYHLSA